MTDLELTRRYPEVFGLTEKEKMSDAERAYIKENRDAYIRQAARVHIQDWDSTLDLDTFQAYARETEKSWRERKCSRELTEIVNREHAERPRKVFA